MLQIIDISECFLTDTGLPGCPALLLRKFRHDTVAMPHFAESRLEAFGAPKYLN